MSWNGIVGKLQLRATSPVWLDDVQRHGHRQRRGVPGALVGNGRRGHDQGPVPARGANLGQVSPGAARPPPAARSTRRGGHARNPLRLRTDCGPGQAVRPQRPRTLFARHPPRRRLPAHRLPAHRRGLLAQDHPDQQGLGHQPHPLPLVLPALADVQIPVVSHEAGQWAAYPDYAIIGKFTGYLQPGNYEIFRDSLARHGMAGRNKDFAWASGKFQVQAYKEEIEANLRTPGLSGYQLLDLHDYLGQGTAPVGVLDTFWEPKGYVTADDFRRFNGPTVPLARLPRRTYTVGETVTADVEVAHYGAAPLVDAQATWQLVDSRGHVAAAGAFARRTIPIGKNIALGKIALPLARLDAPHSYRLEVNVNGSGSGIDNDWRIWVAAGAGRQGVIPAAGGGPGLERPAACRRARVLEPPDESRLEPPAGRVDRRPSPGAGALPHRPVQRLAVVGTDRGRAHHQPGPPAGSAATGGAAGGRLEPQLQAGPAARSQGRRRPADGGHARSRERPRSARGRAPAAPVGAPLHGRRQLPAARRHRRRRHAARAVRYAGDEKAGRHRCRRKQSRRCHRRRSEYVLERRDANRRAHAGDVDADLRAAGVVCGTGADAAPEPPRPRRRCARLPGGDQRRRRALARRPARRAAVHLRPAAHRVRAQRHGASPALYRAVGFWHGPYGGPGRTGSGVHGTGAGGKQRGRDREFEQREVAGVHLEEFGLREDDAPHGAVLVRIDHRVVGAEQHRDRAAERAGDRTAVDGRKVVGRGHRRGTVERARLLDQFGKRPRCLGAAAGAEVQGRDVGQQRQRAEHVPEARPARVVLVRGQRNGQLAGARMVGMHAERAARQAQRGLFGIEGGRQQHDIADQLGRLARQVHGQVGAERTGRQRDGAAECAGHAAQFRQRGGLQVEERARRARFGQRLLPPVDVAGAGIARLFEYRAQARTAVQI
uniref:Uncharacterized protein n=1 Tax=Tanacetum cinerariifolium TaxID=118510 RepID=A0A699GMK3_TANCI|nr:hypothetical protein [Tanacetum cinerariifolium]